MYLYTIIIALLLVNKAQSWDSDQLEVFDVVDEVKVNFYEALNISKDAALPAIKSAFRKQSLLLHPDKNKDVDTSEQFRNLVAIYDILKDQNKRKYYDEVLVNGLPNWRSAVYYYRYVRKMGLMETCIILFIIITIGQYLVAWGAYFEAILNVKQVKGRKQKKVIVPAIEIPKPSFINTLPFQIPMWTYHIIISIPSITLFVYTYFKEKAREKVEEVILKEESEEEVISEPKLVRRRKPAFTIPEGPNFETTTNNSNSTDNKSESQPPPVSGGLWTDDDLEQLITLVKKFPGGTSNRWEAIAEALRRSVPEVTYMANKMKNNGYRLPNQQEEEMVEPPKVKQKTKGGKMGDQAQNGGVWSQNQQKVLEDALIKYPKGCLERWERIAELVPDKTKEECMLRYKMLVEAVKSKKENQNVEETGE